MTIKFFSNNTTANITGRKKLKLFLKELFREERVVFESLTYVFCTDEYLLSINKEFLSHDTYTDIITFTLSKPSTPIVGEIYISVDRVKDNAKILKEKLSRELHRLVFHGALHLCGYNDKNRDDKLSMTLAEDKYLKRYLN